MSNSSFSPFPVHHTHRHNGFYLTFFASFFLNLHQKSMPHGTCRENKSLSILHVFQKLRTSERAAPSLPAQNEQNIPDVTTWWISLTSQHGRALNLWRHNMATLYLSDVTTWTRFISLTSQHGHALSLTSQHGHALSLTSQHGGFLTLQQQFSQVWLHQIMQLFRGSPLAWTKIWCSSEDAFDWTKKAANRPLRFSALSKRTFFEMECRFHFRYWGRLSGGEVWRKK